MLKKIAGGTKGGILLTFDFNVIIIQLVMK